MKDIKMTSYGNLNIVDGDLSLMSDSEALRSQLAIFLTTRSSHRDKLNNLITDGENILDTDYGLDFTLIFDVDMSANQIKAYIVSKINKYFKDIKSIDEFTLSKDISTLVMTVSIKYTDIYGGTEVITI